MASIVSSLVNQNVDIGTLVVNVSGPSSTGKSTIAQLSASLFGSPKICNSGLVRTFNATKNCLLTVCEGRNGLPIILDDANANANEHNRSDLIYQLALGESRGRLNNNGSLQRHRQGWSGLAIITSESSLLEDDKFSRGALVRCIAFDDIRWTQDAAHSDRIKAGTLANYGHVGQRIADYVGNLPTQDLLKDHKDFSDKICAKISIKDGFESRISDKLAPIVMSAKYFNDYTNSNSLDIDELINTLVSIYEASVPSRDAAAVAYAKLLDFITINQSNFGYKTSLRYEDTRQPRGKTFGLIVNRDEAKYVLVIKPVFDEFCKQYGIAEKTSILKKWHNDGVIVTNERDHLTIQSRELQARCYKFPFDSIPEIMLGMPDDPVASPSGCPAAHKTELLPVKCDYDDTETLKAIFGTKEASNDGVA